MDSPNLMVLVLKSAYYLLIQEKIHLEKKLHCLWCGQNKMFSDVRKKYQKSKNQTFSKLFLQKFFFLIFFSFFRSKKSTENKILSGGRNFFDFVGLCNVIALARKWYSDWIFRPSRTYAWTVYIIMLSIYCKH